MEDRSQVKVVAVERLHGSIIITFDEGKCGMYSSEQLRAMLDSARELQETFERAAL